MKKNQKKIKKTEKKQRIDRARFIPGLILLLYILIPTYTPNLYTFDTNAPKFLALSLVNLLAFLFLFSDKKIRQESGLMTAFFKTGPGIVYSAFLFVSLLSMMNAVNLVSSVFQLTKLFTVFTAVYIVSLILMRDMRYLRWIIVLFTLMLIFDSLSVFYHINEFIQGRISNIIEIKTIYSNKNILASAIFVKLPFAIWLLMYGTKRLKYLGWFGLFFGVTGTFFMATRAFYLGLIILSAILLIYWLLQFFRTKQKSRLVQAAVYILAIAMAYLIFTGIQEFLYPKIKSRLTRGVTQQLATISTFDSSASKRIDAWKRSWKLIMENPLFGVGSGNWKVRVLKYENQTSPDYSYMYKAHNDFIETTAETGFIGGLLYLSIFVLVAWAFIRRLFHHTLEEDDLYRYMLLAAAGITFYSVDAFFNFPADRPEIQVLFTFYLSTGIAVIRKQKLEATETKPEQTSAPTGMGFRLIAGMMALLLMAFMSYIFILNFKSSRLQRIAYQEVRSGTLKSHADLFLKGFPWIPNLNINAEPIDVIKARFLINDNRDEEAVALLRAEKASPWDGRREYFMSMAFNKLGMVDSALAYTDSLRLLKPNHLDNILIACQKYEQLKQYDKVTDYIDTYLATNKKSDQAWVFATGFYDRTGNLDKAWNMIEEAKKYLPRDTLVEHQYKYLYHKKFEAPYEETYLEARKEMDNGHYPKAMQLVNEYLGHVPDDFKARRVKAFIYYYMGEYRKSVDEVNDALTLPTDDTGAILNLRGVNYIYLKETDLACKDFEAAMKKGDKDGLTNYNRFCGKK